VFLTSLSVLYKSPLKKRFFNLNGTKIKVEMNK